MDVKTAGRTLEIFEVFSRNQEPMSITDIANAIEIPLSSCLYIARTLEKFGYLYPVGGRKMLYPTRKLLDVASAISIHEPWIERMEPVLQKLRDDSRETVILGKQQGNRAVYLAVYEGLETIRYVARAGDRKPMHSSAIGKALLSAMGRDQLGKFLTKLSVERITPNTIVDRKVLHDDIVTAAARGYAISRGENVADVMAIAKHLTLDGDHYAIAVAGPIHRLSEGIDSLCEKLEAACQAARQ
jgi:DNA-binding IclR family transcriptional regulator